MAVENMQAENKALLSELNSILSDKKEQMKMILELTEAQRELFDSDHYDRLEENLRLKQKCIDTVNKLDADFDKCYTEIKKQIEEEGAAGEPITYIQAAISEIHDYAEKIKQAEAENYKKADAFFQTIRANLQNISKEKKAALSYGKSKSYR